MLRPARTASGAALALLMVASSLMGVVSLTSCADDGQAQAAYLAQVAAADAEAIEAGLNLELARMKAPDDEELSAIAGSLDEAALISLDTYGCTPEELCQHVLARLDYEVGEVEVVSEDTATAQVTITNVDLASALDAAHRRLVDGDSAARLEEGYGSGSEVALMRATMDVIFEEVDTCEKTVATKVTLTLTKEQDLWVTDDEGNAALISAALGGLAVTAGENA